MKKYCFNFECIRDGKVFGHGGSECHGLFFALLNKTDAAFSQLLHQAPINPFTIGPVRGQGKRSNGNYYLQSGTEYRFNISALTEEMEQVVEKILHTCHPAHQFRLGTADCRWVSCKKVEENTYENLLKKKPLDKITFTFTSPTCFRSQGVNLLFPGPDLVFNNLLERWNAFAPIPIESIQTLPFVSKYSLRTSLVKFTQYRMAGFMGAVEFTLSRGTSEGDFIAIAALVGFSSFAGIGYKTGMGMGEITVK